MNLTNNIILGTTAELEHLIALVNEGRKAYRIIQIKYRANVTETAKQFAEIDSLLIKQLKKRR